MTYIYIIRKTYTCTKSHKKMNIICNNKISQLIQKIKFFLAKYYHMWLNFLMNDLMINNRRKSKFCNSISALDKFVLNATLNISSYNCISCLRERMDSLTFCASTFCQLINIICLKKEVSIKCKTE